MYGCYLASVQDVNTILFDIWVGILITFKRNSLEKENNSAYLMLYK